MQWLFLLVLEYWPRIAWRFLVPGVYRCSDTYGILVRRTTTSWEVCSVRFVAPGSSFYEEISRYDRCLDGMIHQALLPQKDACRFFRELKAEFEKPGSVSLLAA